MSSEGVVSLQQVSLLGPPDVDQVLGALRSLRVGIVAYEHDLHQEIAATLIKHGIPFEREVRLAPRNRIDFLCGPIGIEVKKGRPNSEEVRRQIERYCAFDQVQTLVLVVERHVFDHDRSATGKPVHYVALHKLWGIAL